MKRINMEQNINMNRVKKNKVNINVMDDIRKYNIYNDVNTSKVKNFMHKKTHKI